GACGTIPDLAPLVERLGKCQDLRAAKVRQSARRSLADGLDDVISEVCGIHRLHLQVRQRHYREPRHLAEHAVKQPVELGRTSYRPGDRALTDEVFGLELAPQVWNSRPINSDDRDIENMADAGCRRLIEQSRCTLAIDLSRALPHVFWDAEAAASGWGQCRGVDEGLAAGQCVGNALTGGKIPANPLHIWI